MKTLSTALQAHLDDSTTTLSWCWRISRAGGVTLAHLCAAAGGVDAFLIGSEMPGLTTIRSGAATYPAVQAFRDLATAVRAILGLGTKIGYAGDWVEYFGHHPSDGSSDVFFHLDPLWSESNFDFIGIDNYMPLSDWRDGFDHADAALAPAIYDRIYLQSNIVGGEGFDWFYASPSDRAAQFRTLMVIPPILTGCSRRTYAAIFSFWAGVMPPMPMFGRSLL